MRPTTSWPGTRGQSIGKSPSTVPASEWQTPHASTRMRTLSGPGSRSGFLTSENSPGLVISIALYVSFISPPTSFDSDATLGRELFQLIINVDLKELPPFDHRQFSEHGVRPPIGSRSCMPGSIDDFEQLLFFKDRSSLPQKCSVGHLLKLSPNMGRPLFDCSFVASSWITSQCSTRMPSSIRRMSAAIQFTG